jgi:hypothetical protein
MIWLLIPYCIIAYIWVFYYLSHIAVYKDSKDAFSAPVILLAAPLLFPLILLVSIMEKVIDKAFEIKERNK